MSDCESRANCAASMMLAAGVVAAAFGVWGSGPAYAEEAPRIIELTQTACQFVESEGGVDHGYQSSSAADCTAINERSGAERVADAAPLQLQPGKYIFRVTNKNVPYELGFWLRGQGFSRVTLPGTSGGGLTEGVTRDYEIELTEGEYFYSCPLNPTPDYQLIVEG